MSLAMAPEKAFIELIKNLNEHGFKCQETVPVWSCEGNQAGYDKLPSIQMNMILNEKG